MRKIFTKIAMALVVLSLGVGTIGCDKINDVIGGGDIIDIIGGLLGGKTYVYRGTYTMQYYHENATTGKLQPVTEVKAFEGATVQLNTTTNPLLGGTTVKMTLPGTAIVTGVEMSEVVLSGLTLNETDVVVGDTSTGTGTLTVNGTTYALSSVNMTAKVDAENLIITELDLFFGEEQSDAVVVTFIDGKAVVAQ